jgi:hypothetical protein
MRWPERARKPRGGSSEQAGDEVSQGSDTVKAEPNYVRVPPRGGRKTSTDVLDTTTTPGDTLGGGPLLDAPRLAARFTRWLLALHGAARAGKGIV